MLQSKPQKLLKQVLIILSVVAFVGSSAFGIFGLFSGALNPPKEDAKTAAAKSQETKLQEQERGYETVLQREPDNQIALQGVVQARLQKNDLQGAIAPMEKLVKLNPNRADYKALLDGIKERAGKGNK